MEQRVRLLSSRGFRKPTVSKISLFCILLSGFALNLCPLIAFYTDTNNPDLCFVNWRNVLYIGYCFIKLIVALMRSSVRQSVVRYGLWRFLFCIIFVFLSSYILVAVVLDRAALGTWNVFEAKFIKKFEDNVVTINETRKEFTVRDIRSYEPLKLERQMRYRGEDVRLVCEDTLYFDGRVKSHEKQVIWKHNRQRILSSSRYHINTIFEEIPKNDKMKHVAEILQIDFHIYEVKSVLDIYLIEAADFGKYSCHVAKSAISIESENISSSVPGKSSNRTKRENPSDNKANKQSECPAKEEETTCPCPFEELYLLLQRISPLYYSWNAEFVLKEITPNRRTISVPLGSIVSSSASYKHLDDKPIEFDHEINGKSFVDVCSELDQTCSILIYIYWFLWHDGGHFTFIPAFYNRLQMVEGIGGTSWQCVCPYTYGLHKFVFYRHFYNNTLGIYQTIGIEYPDTVEIVPEEPNILDPYLNGTKKDILLVESSCWGDLKTKMCIYLEHILCSIASEFFYRERIICISGLISCLSISIIFSRLFSTWIMNPCINVILERTKVQVDVVEGNLAGLANMTNSVLKYDLYISCAPQQTKHASDIAMYLQSHGLRACHRDDHVLGNEMVTQGISRLISESWRFLVIVTPEYINSGLQNNFEFQLILNRLHRGFIIEHNIALLPSDSNLVPDIFEIFNVFTWPRHGWTNILERVRFWVGDSIFPSQNITSVRIIRRIPVPFTSSFLLSLSCLCFSSLCMILSGMVM